MPRPSYFSCFVHPNDIWPAIPVILQVPVISSLVGRVMFLTGWGLLLKVCLKRAKILADLLIGTIDRRQC
jgi:hypothetical protein